MSAPAAASPVSSTADALAPVATWTEQVVADTSAVFPVTALAGATARFEPRTREALAEATSTLVRAQQLTGGSKLTPKRAKRIEAAVQEVTTLVADATAVPAGAGANRAERASRSGGRTALPASAGQDGAGAKASTGTAKVREVSAASLAEATDNLSTLIARPATSTASDVVPGPSKREIAAAKARAAAKERAAAEARAAAEEAAERKAEKKAEQKAAAQAKASRAGARSKAPANAAPKLRVVENLAAEAQQYGNGQLPGSLLCGVSFTSDSLRCDAAVAAEKLNAAFRSAFGRNLTVNDAYRSYEDQVAVKATHGALAAPPGTSNHGWGQALDLGGGISTFGSAEYNWMKAKAPGFGWVHPDWAEPTGSKPEAWHWEYAG
ncbi:M15 family metallopeptidase [Myceligenerans crystallogenes]